MLKKSKIAFIFFILMGGSSFQASADPNTVLANICTLVESDDKGQLRKKVKTMKSDYGMKLADYYNGITCNGQTLIRHAIKLNSAETGAFLIKKMSKKALKTPMSDSMTELDWAKSNGFEGSALTAALQDRIN